MTTNHLFTLLVLLLLFTCFSQSKSNSGSFSLDLFIGGNYTDGLSASESSPFFTTYISEYRLIYLDKRNGDLYYSIGGVVIRKLDRNGKVHNVVGNVRNVAGSETDSINDHHYALDRMVNNIGGSLVDYKTDDFYFLNMGKYLERVRKSDKKSIVSVGYASNSQLPIEGLGNQISFAYTATSSVYVRGLAINSNNEIYMLQREYISKYNIGNYRVVNMFGPFEPGTYSQIVLSKDETFLFARTNDVVDKFYLNGTVINNFASLNGLTYIDSVDNELYMLSTQYGAPGVYVYRDETLKLIAGGTYGSFVDGMNSANLKLNYPSTMLVNDNKDIYLSDLYGTVVLKVDYASQLVSNLFPLSSENVYSAKNFTSRGFSSVVHNTVSGFLYMCDSNGIYIYDGNLITKTSSYYCKDIAINSLGDVYFLSSNYIYHLLRNGTVTIYAGNGNNGIPINGSYINQSPIVSERIGFYSNNDMFIQSQYFIFRVNRETKLIQLVYAHYKNILQTTIDLFNDNLYISDGQTITRVYNYGNYEIIAGGSLAERSITGNSRSVQELDGESAFNSLINPTGMAIGLNGKLFVSYGDRLRVIDNGLIWTQSFVDSHQGPISSIIFKMARILGRYNESIMVTNSNGNIYLLKPINDPNCFGIPSTSANVCSGFGSCSGLNRCTCNNSNFGLECEYSTCFDISGFDYQTVCNGRGYCTKQDECNCQEGYYGTICYSVPIFNCFGLLSNSSNVCSGNGVCLSNNRCSCVNNFYGSTCEEFGRSLELVGKPKVLVRGKNQTLDISIVSSTFFFTDFGFSKELNNCSNCALTDSVYYTWKLVDSNNKIVYMETSQPLVAVFNPVSISYFKLSFSPVISLKTTLPSTIQEGNLTLTVRFHTFTEYVELNETLFTISSPKRIYNNSSIWPISGMSLSTVFNLREEVSNWMMDSKIALQYAFAFKNLDGNLVRITEFSKWANATTFLPFDYRNIDLMIYVIGRDDYFNEYSELMGTVKVIQNTEDYSIVRDRIRNNPNIVVILPYDEMIKKVEVVYETLNSIIIDSQTPSLTLSSISQITSNISLEEQVSSSLVIKIDVFLDGINVDILKDKNTNGFLKKQRLSDFDIQNTLTTASNLLFNGNSNISNICTKLSSIIMQQQATKVNINTLDSILFTSRSVNITAVNFWKSKSTGRENQHFNDVNITTDYILEKYNVFSQEIGLSLISFNSVLHGNKNTTQLTMSKEFTMYKNGIPLPLTDLVEPISISFYLESNTTTSNLSCQYWNITNQQWETNGCIVHSFDNKTRQMTCLCNHTTLFAAFVEQETPNSKEYLQQVSSLYVAQITFGCLFLILASTLIIVLVIFRKEQPIASRFVTPFIGMIAFIIECALLLITQRAILLGYVNSVLGIDNDFENSQSTVLQLQNGDLTANIISNVFTIIVNTTTLTGIFSYLYQVLRFIILKYFYHQIQIRFYQNDQESNLLRITKQFLSTKSMIFILTLFIMFNISYWTLWVILVRLNVISGIVYTYVVSISFTSSVLMLGFVICCFITLSFFMNFSSSKKVENIIGEDKKQSQYSLNDLVSGKVVKNLKSKEVTRFPFTNLYEKLMEEDSPLYFRFEMGLFILCFIFLLISQIIGISGLSYRKSVPFKRLIVNDSISLLFDVLFMFTYLLIFGGYCLLVVFWRKLKQRNILEDNEDITNLLNSVEGLQLFEWFCEKEYSLENLQLYLEIKQKRTVLESNEREMIKSFSVHIYETYIRSNSLKEVNIPSDCRKVIQELVKRYESAEIELENKDTKQSTVLEAFELLQSNVILNLCDTFSRFTQTPQYEVYQLVTSETGNKFKEANLE